MRDETFDGRTAFIILLLPRKKQLSKLSLCIFSRLYIFTMQLVIFNKIVKFLCSIDYLM